MTITVANIRHTREGVYIGRAMPGLKGSALGNPYRLKKGEERSWPIMLYETWLNARLQTDSPQHAEIMRLVEIARQGDLVLLCWCAPLSCHGDVVKQVIEDYLAQYPGEAHDAT